MAFGKRYLNQNTGDGGILMKLIYQDMRLGGGKISIKFAVILSMGLGSKSALGG